MFLFPIYKLRIKITNYPLSDDIPPRANWRIDFPGCHRNHSRKGRSQGHAAYFGWVAGSYWDIMAAYIKAATSS